MPGRDHVQAKGGENLGAGHRHEAAQFIVVRVGDRQDLDGGRKVAGGLHEGAIEADLRVVGAYTTPAGGDVQHAVGHRGAAVAATGSADVNIRPHAIEGAAGELV